MTPADVPGLIRNRDGDLLARLAAEVPPGQAIVEIGSFAGKSTCYLASGAQPAVQVYAVDPWDLHGDTDVGGVTGPVIASTRSQVRELFEHHIRACGYADVVVQVMARSTFAAQQWDGPLIGLLHVDGDHTTEGVRGDIDAWWLHLAPGATVLFDDYRHRLSVRAAVDELGLPVELVGGRFALVRP